MIDAPSTPSLRPRSATEILLFLVPPVAAVGPYLLPATVAGVSLYAFRVLVAVAVPILLIVLRGRLVGFDRPVRIFASSLYLWILWGAASIAWTPSTTAGAAEVLTLIFGGAAVLLLVVGCAMTDERGIHAVRRGWVAAYLIAAAIAVWEVRTGRHLQGYFTENIPVYAQSVVIATFGNPNNYAAFIVLAFPFLVWSVGLARGAQKIFYVAVCLSAPVLVVLTAGRLSLVALVLELLTLASLQGRGWRTLAWLLVGGALAGGVLVTTLNVNPQTLDKLLRVRSELHGGGSASIRLNLTLDGLKFTLDSFGLGTGAGSFESVMLAGRAPLPTERIINPHNFWIEILAQYGVFVFAAFVGWLGYLCAAVVRLLGSQFVSSTTRYWAVPAAGMALVGYAFAAVENSRFIPQPTNWIFLGTVLVLISALRREASDAATTACHVP